MESWLFTTHKGVIVAMVVASLLPYAFAMLAKILGGFTTQDNKNPRQFLANLSGMASRANAVQQNSFESLPLFLTASVLSLLYFIPIKSLAMFAWLYIVLRILYGVAYLLNWASFRSIVWALSMACPLFMLYIVFRLS